jgi:hypothetical protein
LPPNGVGVPKSTVATPRTAKATRRLCVAGVLAVCAFAMAHQPPVADAAALSTGLSGLNEEVPLAFERVKAAGASYVRIPFEWSEIAPDNPPGSWQPQDHADPNYDWERTDRAVIGAVAAGLTPVAMIEEAPLWAQRCRTSLGSNCDPDPAALADFATAAARRYSGTAGLPRVSFWQGLNEPNLSIYFSPQFEGDRPVSPDLYRTLANAFYAAVKAVDPTNIVIAAGLGPIAVPRYTIGPMRFTRLLLCMRGHRNPKPTRGDCGGGVHFDVFDIHPYTTGAPSHAGGINDVQMGDLAKLTELLDAADRAGRIKGAFRHTPLWIGEFSWDSNPPDPGGLAMKIETRWVAEALYRSWRAGVEAFFWFSLRDRRPNSYVRFSETIESGLYFRGATIEQDQPKEILYAFRFPFVSYPSRKGLFFWGRTPTSQRGKVAIQIWKRGRWRGAFAARADGDGIFRGRIPNRYGTNRHGSVRAVYRGEATVPFSMRPSKDVRQPPFG